MVKDKINPAIQKRLVAQYRILHEAYRCIMALTKPGCREHDRAAAEVEWLGVWLEHLELWGDNE